MSKFTDPIRDLRRCRFCGLDTIDANAIGAHEDDCTDNPDNVEPIDPEGDRGPCYLPDPTFDDSELYGDPDCW